MMLSSTCRGIAKDFVYVWEGLYIYINDVFPIFINPNFNNIHIYKHLTTKSYTTLLRRKKHCHVQKNKATSLLIIQHQNYK